MRGRGLLCALCGGAALAQLLLAVTAGAQGVTVESGARFALGVGTLAMGCGDVVVGGRLEVGSGLLDGARGVSVLPGGTLAGGSGTIRSAGPWSNAGGFFAGTGTVELGDGCGVTNTSILGSSRFWNLTLTTATNKRFAFELGSTQTVDGHLQLSGAAGNLLRIRSTGPGAAFFDVVGSSSTSYVDVEDNSAVPGKPILLGSESIKGANSWGWLLTPAIPALPVVALGALAAGLAWLGAGGLRRRRVVARSLLAGALLLTALWQTSAHAIVDTDAPVSGPPLTAPLPFPDPTLSATGGFPFPAPLGYAGELLVREGQYSWAPDVAAPSLVHLEGSSCKGHALGEVLPLDPTQATSELATHMGEALDESKITVDQLDSGGVGDFLGAAQLFLDALAALPGASLPNPDVGAMQRACVAYAPLHARWLAAEYAKATPSASFETHFFYHPNPRPFREIRERGARLYCAARAAQFAQGDQVPSMGTRVGFSVNVVGEPVDFFVTKATLVLDGPQRFTGMGVDDGAQAFEVPLLLGTQITPIRGLPLPGFREVRVPLSLVTADSEVQTKSFLRLIPRPGQVVIQDYDETHQTASHWDAVQSARKHASFGVVEPASLELFRVGPLAVKLGFSIDYGVGELESQNDRVIFLPGVPGARTGRLWVQGGSGRRVHDGAWQPRFSPIGFGLPFPPHWAVRPDGLTDPFWREPITLLSLLAPLHLDVRLLQNDDHAGTSTTTLTLGGTLSAEAGCCSFPPFDVSLTLTGGVQGTVSQIFHVRDALLTQDRGGARMTPIAGLGVRSSQTATAGLSQTEATLHFALDLPGPFLDNIEFDKTLFSIDPVPLASYDSDDDLPASNADDSSNLRLATGSASGNVLKQPVVSSHLPGSSGEFLSFPGDVDACLADPTPNPDTPGLCDPPPAQGSTPQAELCVYGPSNLLEALLQAGLPAQVCDGKIAAFVASLLLSEEQKACIQSYLEFLCSGTHQQQALAGNFSEVVSHVLELEDPAELAAFDEMLQTCGRAFGHVNEDGGVSGASEVAEQLLSFGVCDDQAKLLENDEILGAIDPGVPPLTEDAPCH